LGQNKSNTFEIHLNNSQLSLFIQARPTSFFFRSAHARPMPLSPPSLSHCRSSPARQQPGAARSYSKQSASPACAATGPWSAGTRSRHRPPVRARPHARPMSHGVLTMDPSPLPPSFPLSALLLLTRDQARRRLPRPPLTRSTGLGR
jgi:hypothetical protein